MGRTKSTNAAAALLEKGQRAFDRGDFATAAQRFAEAHDEAAPGSEEATALYFLGVSKFMADPGEVESAYKCISEAEDLFLAAGEEANAGTIRELIDSVDWSGIIAAKQAPKASTGGWGAVLGGLGGLLFGQASLGASVGTWVEKQVQSQPVRLTYGGRIADVDFAVVPQTAEAPAMLQLDVQLSVTNYLWRTCIVASFFSLRGQKRFLKAANPEWADRDGDLITRCRFAPSSAAAQLTIPLQVPTAQLQSVLPAGKTDLDAHLLLVRPGEPVTQLHELVVPFYFQYQPPAPPRRPSSAPKRR